MTHFRKDNTVRHVKEALQASQQTVACLLCTVDGLDFRLQGFSGERLESGLIEFIRQG